MPMEDTYGIQSRIGSIIVVERWYCCRGSPVFSDRNIQIISFPSFVIIIVVGNARCRKQRILTTLILLAEK